MNLQKSLQTSGTITNPILDKCIEEKHKEYLHQAQLLGVTTAIQNTIQPDTPLHVICESVEMNYGALAAHALKECNGILGIAQGKLEIEQIQTRNETILHEIGQLQTTLAIEKSKTGNITIPTVPYRQLAVGAIIGLLLLFAEIFFIGNSFQGTGAGLGIALLIGLGISLSILIVSTVGIAQAEKIPDKKKRRLALLGLGILVSSAVYILSLMREKFYQSQTGQDIGAGKLALLTLLIFTATHFLYKHLSPVIQRMKERREALDKLSKIKKQETKLENLKQTYTANLEKINAIKQFRLAVLAYSKSLEISIMRMYRQAVAELKKAFITQAGYAPASFTDAPSDLTRYYDEINITTTTHEKPE